MVTIAKLPPQTEAEIQGLIASGGYDDATEIVVQAIHQFAQREQSLADLRAKIQIGLDEIERDEIIRFTPERSAQLLESARRRLEAGEHPSADVCP